MNIELTAKDIYFSYKKKPVINGLNLHLKTGVNVLLGANGCGKSTLIKILAQIYPLKKGSIFLGNKNYSESTELKRSISYLPQDFNIYPNLKGIELLHFIAGIKLKKDKKRVKEEVNKVIELTNISDFVEKKQKTYSMGMKQRLGIAQCLIGNPKLILVDEPTASLDPQHRHEFNNLLSAFKENKIILSSTHIVEDIAAYHDNIIVMNEGKITYTGHYNEFVHSCDGKVYTGYASYERKPYIHNKYMVLSEENLAEGIRFKIVGDIDIMDFKNVCQETEVTMKDIWSYHIQKKGVNTHDEVPPYV